MFAASQTPSACCAACTYTTESNSEGGTAHECSASGMKAARKHGQLGPEGMSSHGHAMHCNSDEAAKLLCSGPHCCVAASAPPALLPGHWPHLLLLRFSRCSRYSSQPHASLCTLQRQGLARGNSKPPAFVRCDYMYTFDAIAAKVTAAAAPDGVWTGMDQLLQPLLPHSACHASGDRRGWGGSKLGTSVK
jgi:hypothetical protein